MKMYSLSLSIIALVSLSACCAVACQITICSSYDCLSGCSSQNTTLSESISGILNLDDAFVTCGPNLTTVYGATTSTKELQFYYAQPDTCQQFLGGSWTIIHEKAPQIATKQALNTCQNDKLYTCEPSQLVERNCSDLSIILSRTLSNDCPSVVFGMCAHFRSNVTSLLIAVAIFPLFLALCFSVYASLPCVIFANDGKQIVPTPYPNDVIFRNSLAHEVKTMMQLNGPASPSTVSEYATSTFRGNAILLASCLMSSTCLLLLNFIGTSITMAHRGPIVGTRWLKIVCYLLISVVGFFPSAPPSKIRSRTPSLWCSFGDTCGECECGNMNCPGLNTSIIQNIAHMCSFFVAILLFIASEFVELSITPEWIGFQSLNTTMTSYNTAFAAVLLIQLVFLIVFQAPINIAKMPSMGCIQCWICSTTDSIPLKERNRKWLNASAAAAFLVEVSLASCLICFALYEELLPISMCVGIPALALYPWIIVALACCIGYTAGFLVAWEDKLLCRCCNNVSNSPA